jgi:hypothetical protein
MGGSTRDFWLFGEILDFGEILARFWFEGAEVQAYKPSVSNSCKSGVNQV